MKLRRWIEIELSLPLREHELVTGQLARLGCTGFEQEDHSLKCFVEKDQWDAHRKKSFCSTLARFREEVPGPAIAVQTRFLEEQNWNRLWEASIGVVEATRNIVIRPSWKKLRKKDKRKIVIQIDPKMSFGTGHHETTRLSLVLLEEYIRPKLSVLDVGCGTGVLSIAAAKLGAKKVVALDHDPWAIANARENVRNNGVTESVRFVLGETRSIPSVRFDLITANLDFPTIVGSLKALNGHLSSHGILVLSGLLLTDVSSLLPRLSHQDLIPLQLINENEWVGMALLKN